MPMVKLRGIDQRHLINMNVGNSGSTYHSPPVLNSFDLTARLFEVSPFVSPLIS